MEVQMPQHETLAAALAAFQAELPKLTKDQTAKVRGESNDGRPVNYSYGYASLDQVTETVSPVLGKHGLSFSAYPTMNDKGQFVLTYLLAHESGESREGTWPLPDPLRTKPQQLGSAVTYARRYAFMAVTNTFPGGEDDDGAAAVPTGHRDRAMSPEEFDKLPRERPQQQRPENAPTSPAGPKPEKVWTESEVQEMHNKLDTLELDKAATLYDWMAARDLHNRKIGTLTEEGVEPVSATTRLAIRLATLAMDDTTTVENLSWLREFGDQRGLLKTQVSPRSNLDDWLTEQKKARTAAVVGQSENAQAMKQAAADSWDAPQGEGDDQRQDTGPDGGSSSAAIGQGD